MNDDPYAPLADLYDLAYGDFDDDIDFYENLAQAVDGPILELGVGTGRVAVPLALAGYEVVGLDASASMLEQARANAFAAKVPHGRIDFRAGDMTKYDLDRRFGLVVIAADTFQHLLTTQQQRDCLGCIGRHLEPGGIATISIRSPTSVSWEDTGLAPLLLHWVRPDPATGDTVMKLVATTPDAAKMTHRLTYIYDRIRDGGVRRTLFETELRYSTQSEIGALLQQSGLRVTHVYGDYDLSPVGPGTDNLIFVARAEKSR